MQSQWWQIEGTSLFPWSVGYALLFLCIPACISLCKGIQVTYSAWGPLLVSCCQTIQPSSRAVTQGFLSQVQSLRSESMLINTPIALAGAVHGQGKLHMEGMGAQRCDSLPLLGRLLGNWNAVLCLASKQRHIWTMITREGERGQLGQIFPFLMVWPAPHSRWVPENGPYWKGQWLKLVLKNGRKHPSICSPGSWNPCFTQPQMKQEMC